MQGPRVFGALVNNIRDFAGQSSRGHISQLPIQPFINYYLPDGWYLPTVPIITVNWKANSSDPFNLSSFYSFVVLKHQLTPALQGGDE